MLQLPNSAYTARMQGASQLKLFELAVEILPGITAAGNVSWRGPVHALSQIAADPGSDYTPDPGV